jgi:hypothetical protein
LHDLTNEDWIGRFAHASQFVVLLWGLFEKEHLEIHFASVDGTPRGKVWAKGKDIAELNKLEDPFEELINVVHLEPIR